MNNERFFNAYVELLTSNFHDALGKNIVFQAQAKINVEDQEELKKKIEILENRLEEFGDIEKNIEEKDHELLDKNAEIGRLKNEFEQVKAESNHLNTFKNELISARQELQNKNKEIQDLNSLKEREKNEIRLDFERKIKVLTDDKNISILELTREKEKVIQELNSKIEYLQMTPAQRRKLDAKNSVSSEKENLIVENSSEDGGTF